MKDAAIDERFYVHWAWIAFLIGFTLGVAAGMLVG